MVVGKTSAGALTLLVMGVVGLVVVTTPMFAIADEVSGEGGGYAEFSFDTSGATYTGTMDLGGGFPSADFTTDSRAGSIGVVSGASTFLNPSTPPGGFFGSSQNRPYLNLRPAADQPDAPSTTTYSFTAPTPSGGWGFVLGDVDADRIVISATGADGAPVSAEELGFQGVFNYCGGSPSVCTPTEPASLPSWDSQSFTLDGNPEAADTDGAAAWFRPAVSLTSLTFTYFQRSGLPIYQTWFASIARDISGVVRGCTTDGTGPVAGATVTLLDASGRIVATTLTASDGSYGFRDYVATSYSVVLSAPDGCDGITTAATDTSDSDQTVDFELTPEPVTPTPLPTTPPATSTPADPLEGEAQTPSAEEARLADSGPSMEIIGAMMAIAVVVVIGGAGLASLRQTQKASER